MKKIWLSLFVWLFSLLFSQGSSNDYDVIPVIVDHFRFAGNASPYRDSLKVFRPVIEKVLEKMNRFTLLNPRKYQNEIIRITEALSGVADNSVVNGKSNALSLKTAKYLFRGEIIYFQTFFKKVGSISYRVVEVDLSVSVIDTEQLTRKGYLRFSYKEKAPKSLKTMDDLLKKILKRFQKDLEFKIKDVLKITLTVTGRKPGRVYFSRGRETGVRFGMRFKLYEKKRFYIQDDFGHFSETELMKPVGDARIIKSRRGKSTGIIRLKYGKIRQGTSAVEWNLKNYTYYFGVGVRPLNFSCTPQDIVFTNDAGKNYTLTPLENPGLKTSLNDLSPVMTFGFGKNISRFLFFGDVSGSLSSPLSSFSLDAGLSLTLFDSRFFTLELSASGRGGYYFGRIGRLTFDTQNARLNHIDTERFGNHVPLGSSVELREFTYGAVFKIRTGMSLSYQRKIIIEAGYHHSPVFYPDYFLYKKKTVLNSQRRVYDVTKYYAPAAELQLSGFSFKLLYSYLL